MIYGILLIMERIQGMVLGIAKVVPVFPVLIYAKIVLSTIKIKIILYIESKFTH